MLDPTIPVVDLRDHQAAGQRRERFIRSLGETARLDGGRLSMPFFLHPRPEVVLSNDPGCTRSRQGASCSVACARGVS